MMMIIHCFSRGYFNATIGSIGIVSQRAYSNVVFVYEGGKYVKLVIITVTMSESQQKKPDLGLLEEDDEFEEFPAEGLLNLITTRNVNFVTKLHNCTVMVQIFDCAGHVTVLVKV